MEKIGTPVGSYAPDFELPGIDGQVHHLSRYLHQWRAVGVVFLSNHCPYVLSYLDRLKSIQARFNQQGLTLIGINANDANRYPEDDFQHMKTFARHRDLNFPYLWDPTQDVACGFGAQKTPEAFLIDQSGILRYSGRIDDNPHDAEAVERPYFEQAIAALLRGGDITPTTTEAVGSPLAWRTSV